MVLKQESFQVCLNVLDMTSLSNTSSYQGCPLRPSHRQEFVNLGTSLNPSPFRPIWQGSKVSLVQPFLGPKVEETQFWGLGPRNAW